LDDHQAVEVCEAVRLGGHEVLGRSDAIEPCRQKANHGPLDRIGGGGEGVAQRGGPGGDEGTSKRYGRAVHQIPATCGSPNLSQRHSELAGIAQRPIDIDGHVEKAEM
jgi:hypothetical protein